MDQLLAPLLSFVLLYKYAALFAVMLGSDIIFVLPSNALTLIVGFLSGTPYLNFYWSWLVIAAANTCGDCLMYELARHHPERISRHLQRRGPAFLERWKKFIEKSSGLTIIFSRFAGVLGVAVNLLSGLAPIPRIKFLFFDVLGNILLSGLLLYLGFVVGANWEGASDIVDVISVSLGVAILAVFIYQALPPRQKQPIE
jgi:membrane-associated protein